VRELALEVASEIVATRDEAVKTFEPGMGFDNFGDSNVVFWVWIQAKDRLSSFNLKSELIIRLHQRFQQENITINYPVRVTYLKWPDDATEEIMKNVKKQA
jgi:small-conductance mechanosensitive channel